MASSNMKYKILTKFITDCLHLVVTVTNIPLRPLEARPPAQDPANLNRSSSPGTFLGVRSQSSRAAIQNRNCFSQQFLERRPSSGLDEKSPPGQPVGQIYKSRRCIANTLCTPLACIAMQPKKAVQDDVRFAVVPC